MKTARLFSLIATHLLATFGGLAVGYSVTYDNLPRPVIYTLPRPCRQEPQEPRYQTKQETPESGQTDKTSPEALAKQDAFEKRVQEAVKVSVTAKPVAIVPPDIKTFGDSCKQEDGYVVFELSLQNLGDKDINVLAGDVVVQDAQGGDLVTFPISLPQPIAKTSSLVLNVAACKEHALAKTDLSSVQAGLRLRGLLFSDGENLAP